jgi:hypothetical protein
MCDNYKQDLLGQVSRLQKMERYRELCATNGS